MRSNIRSADDSGFNMYELMAVVAIIGVILMIAVASYAVSTATAARVACNHNRRELANAVQLFASEHPGEATSLADLTPYVKNPQRATHCPRDPSVEIVFRVDTRTVTCPIHPN